MLASVVIPTRDAGEQLLYTLFSFNLQFTSFEEFEVIVLDNASRDETSQKVSRFAAHYPLQYARFDRQMPFYHLLNAGIQQAAGELVIFLACNMIVPREFIGIHQHVHEQDAKQVLLGLDVRRIYSVYEPRFSASQHAECSDWLEQYPQIKRPHLLTQTIPLLEEGQIVSGLPFHIGLPCPEAEKRKAARQAYGPRLERHRAPWALFQTSHVSFRREAIIQTGPFKKLPRPDMEREMARRLLRNGYRFQFADKLTLLKQERAWRKAAEQKLPSKNRRAK